MAFVFHPAFIRRAAISLAAVALAGAVYVRRWMSVRAQHGARGAPGWRLASFLGGLVLGWENLRGMHRARAESG